MDLTLSTLFVLALAAFLLWAFTRSPDGPSQRDRELAELRELYERVAGGLYPDPAPIERQLHAVFDALEVELSHPLRKCLAELIDGERFGEEPDFERLDLKEQIDLKQKLRHWEKKKVDGQEHLDEFLFDLFIGLGVELPKVTNPSPFTIPFFYALKDAREWPTRMIATLHEEQLQHCGMFEALTARLYQNLCRASGIDPFDRGSKPLRHAKDSNEPLDRINDVYMAGTPFHALFKSPVPLKFTHEDRYNHMHIVGGSGAGKTTLIENLIRYDAESEERPSIVLIDPHSDLVRRLFRSKDFNDTLAIERGVAPILIDPRDIQYPPAINIFALNRERLAGYGEMEREQVSAGVIQTLSNVLAGLFDLDLSGKQSTFFRYVCRLMLALPDVEGRNATLLDMLELMRNPAPYKLAMESLPAIQRDFFTTDFNENIYKQTREQIRYRLQSIIENPTMARLFTNRETKLDFFAELNRSQGSVILIDTAKDFLKDNSAIFGQIMIGLILQAIQERAAIEPNKRKPTFLIIDEAADFFSDNIDDLLTDARKQKCGLVLAHQYLDQASSGLRASLHANTGIKFASGLSAQDAGAMAREMRTQPEFVQSQRKLEFAAYVRNVTPTAISIPIRFPEPSDDEFEPDKLERKIAQNRERVFAAASEPGYEAAAASDRTDSEYRSHRNPDRKGWDAKSTRDRGSREDPRAGDDGIFFEEGDP